MNVQRIVFRKKRMIEIYWKEQFIQIKFKIDIRNVYGVYMLGFICQHYRKIISTCNYTHLICLNIMVPVASILEATTFDNNTCNLIAEYLEYHPNKLIVQQEKYEKHRDIILNSDYFIYVTLHIINKFRKNKFIIKYLE